MGTTQRQPKKPMKMKTYKCFGIPFEILVQETEAEYNTAAERPNACVEDAVDYTIYHATMGPIRTGFVKGVEETTGVKPKRDDAGKRMERDGEYISRVNAELAYEGDELAPVMDKLMVERDAQGALIIQCDPSTKVRVSEPKEVAKTYRVAAEGLYQSNPDKVQGIGAKLLELNKASNVRFQDGDMDDKGLYTIAGLARLISVNEARKRAAANLSKQYADVTTLQ